MRFRIRHIEDSISAQADQVIIPRAFLEARVDGVDLFECCCVCDRHFIGRDPNEGSISFMQSLDMMNTLSGNHGSFQGQIGEACVQWPGNLV